MSNIKAGQTPQSVRRPQNPMTAPLADVRIIAIEQYGAGPWGTLQLADLGAEVIKIEDPALGGDQPKKLRLTYEDLSGINPKIVCCSLSGFGNTGPRASEAGYDYIMQGMSGWMSLTGDPAGPPTKSGLSLVDLSGGYASAIALLAGLWSARRDGRGCDCDISLYETALHELM